MDPGTDFAQQRLDKAARNHIELHVKTYGTEYVKPKLHLNHCLGKQYKKRKRVPDEFSSERLHLRVKEHAELMKNLSCFSPMVLSRVLTRQIGWLNDGTLMGGLRGKLHERCIDGEHVTVSDYLECGGLKVSIGDVVVAPSAVGFVKCCFQDSSGRLLMVVACWGSSAR